MITINRGLALAAVFLLACAACSRETKQSQQQAATEQGADQPVAAKAKDGDRKVLQNKGSDTLVNVAQAWAEEYKKVDPSVAIAVTGGGSGTGISALLNGTVDIANASRSIKDKEKEIAEGKGIHGI